MADADRAKQLVLNLILFGVSLSGCLILAEIVLCVAGFSFHLYPSRIEFGWPSPEVIHFAYRPDPKLLWVLKDYDERLAEGARERPDVVFMGDSCTEFADFDDRFARLMADRPGGVKPEILELGTGGWSSYQGLRQLERDVAPLGPRVVVIYYGWNDHWMGFSLEDKDVARYAGSLVYRLKLGRLRVVQLITKTLFYSNASGETPPLRVSPADYRANLESMVDIAEENDIVPLLVTAPSNHEVGKEPEYLRERHIYRLEELVPLHQEYLAIVRDVAREPARLCDIARGFDAVKRERDPESEPEELFLEDGIHLTEAGAELTARLLVNCFESEGLLR